MLIRYIGPRSVRRLIGSYEWSRETGFVQDVIDPEMAAELLRLAAVRQASRGFEFSPDSPWQREFEESFEFESLGEETKVVSEMEYELPYRFLGKLLDTLLVKRSIRADMQAMWERLKTHVERLP